MATSRRPQRTRRPPTRYGQDHDDEDDLEFLEQFRPPSPARTQPVDTRPPFDPSLPKQCAFPSLDPTSHSGPGPSEVYKARRQIREQRELQKMVEYDPWYHAELAKVNKRKKVVGWRDLGVFPHDVEVKESEKERVKRAKSRGASMVVVEGGAIYYNTPGDREKWNRSKESHFVWGAGSDEEEGGQEEEEEKEEDTVQQRDMQVRTERLMISVRNINHEKQKEAVAAVERARSRTAQGAQACPTPRGAGVPLPSSASASTTNPKAGGRSHQKDAEGDTVMGGNGNSPHTTRQLIRSLPKPEWKLSVYRREMTPPPRRRPTAAEKGKGREGLPEQVLPEPPSRTQGTLRSTPPPHEFDGYFHGYDPFWDVDPFHYVDPTEVKEPTLQVSLEVRLSMGNGELTRSNEQILNTYSVATTDWSSLPANMQYLITYLLTVVRNPPYSFSQMMRLLKLSTDETMTLLFLINQETRKIIVLNNLSNQLANMADVEGAVRDALDRLKPQSLITDTISREDIRQARAFLTFMGLPEVEKRLDEYVGVSTQGNDGQGRYVIKVNGKLLDGDVPDEVVGAVMWDITREEEERERAEQARIVEEVRRAEEAARAASMLGPTPLGLVNPSVLELPLAEEHRRADNGTKVLTVQEAEQAAMKLAELGLLVPESGHYTIGVGLNGESVELVEGRRAREIWEREVEAMRRAERQRQQQQAMPPPDRPAPPPDRPAPSPEESPKSPNSQTNDLLLYMGIDLSIHKPPSVDTPSADLDARTAAFLGQPDYAAILAAIDEEDAIKDAEEAAKKAAAEQAEKEAAERAASETRTLRSRRSASVYSIGSRYPSETPSATPVARPTTRATRAGGNRQAPIIVEGTPEPQLAPRAAPAVATTATATARPATARGNRQVASTALHASPARPPQTPPRAAAAASTTAGMGRAYQQATTTAVSPNTLPQPSRPAPRPAPVATRTARTTRGIRQQTGTAASANPPPQPAPRAAPATAATARAARGSQQPTSTVPANPPSQPTPRAAPTITTTARAARGTRQASNSVPAGNPPLQPPRAVENGVSRRSERKEEARTSGEGPAPAQQQQPIEDRPAQNGSASGRTKNPVQKQQLQVAKNPAATATEREPEIRQRHEVQATGAPEAKVSTRNGIPHHAPAGHVRRSSRQAVPTASTTTAQRQEEARLAPEPAPEPVATPSRAPETPAVSSSQKKKVRIVLNHGGRRVVSHEAEIDVTDPAPRTEPRPVPERPTSPPTLGRGSNFTEPTKKRYRGVSQERPAAGDDATLGTASGSSINESLPTVRTLFGRGWNERYNASYPAQRPGTLDATQHHTQEQQGRVPTPPLGISRPPPPATTATTTTRAIPDQSHQRSQNDQSHQRQQSQQGSN